MRSWLAVLILGSSFLAIAQTTPTPDTKAQTDPKPGAEILSDTRGVDFGPYLQATIAIIKRNWSTVIPKAALPPELKRGHVAIEFAIMKSGKLAGIRLKTSSGDTSLDRAALASVTASNPFAPLPENFDGRYLALRFHYYYNLPKESKLDTGGAAPPK